MNTQVFKKIKGTETVSERELTITYEYLEGEKPSKIEARYQGIKDGVSETITSIYDFNTKDVQHQVFKIKMGEYSAIITRMEELFTEVVESFNTQE